MVTTQNSSATSPVRRSDFAERLVRLRRSAGLSQSELAGSDLSASYVSLLESGKRQPSRDVVTVLAKRLRCSPSMLIDGESSERERRIELELNYARLALTHGEASDARNRLTQLLAEGDLLPPAEDDATLLLASAHERLGELHRAIEVLNPVYQRSRQGRSHLPVSAVGVVLCGCLMDLGESHRAMVVGQEALEAAVGQGLAGTEDYYRLASTVLSTYCEIGDLDNGMAWARSLIEDAEANGNAFSQAAIYWNAAYLAQGMGNIGEALHLSRRALSIYSEGENVRDLPRLRVAMAQLLLSDSPPRMEEAWASLRAAEAQLSDLGSQVDKAAWESTASMCRLLLDDVEGAWRYASSASARAAHCEPARQAEILLLAGDVQAARGNAVESLESYERAMAVLDSSTSRRATARLWRDLADRFEDYGDRERATAGYQRALSLLGIGNRSEAVRLAIRAARTRVAEPR